MELEGEDMQLLEREQEESAQELRDQELHAAHERAQFRDWENWVTLNTPNQPKRRRLVLTKHPGPARALRQGETGESVAVEVPNDLRGFHFTLHFDQVAIEVNRERGEGFPTSHGGAEGTGPAPTFGGPLFRTVQRAWETGHITDEGVLQIYGHEWLLFFQIAKGVTVNSDDQVVQLMTQQEQDEFVDQNTRRGMKVDSDGASMGVGPETVSGHPRVETTTDLARLRELDVLTEEGALAGEVPGESDRDLSWGTTLRGAGGQVVLEDSGEMDQESEDRGGWPTGAGQVWDDDSGSDGKGSEVKK